MKTYFSKVDKAAFEGEIDSKKTGLFILKNDNGLELSVTNFGARVVELFAPDRSGNFADVVLGHASLDKYVNFPGERFYGATRVTSALSTLSRWLSSNRERIFVSYIYK